MALSLKYFTAFPPVIVLGLAFDSVILWSLIGRCFVGSEVKL